jgi:hypothetical protein
MKANDRDRKGLSKDQIAWISGLAAIILVAGLSWSTGVFSKVEPASAATVGTTSAVAAPTGSDGFDEPIAEITEITEIAESNKSSTAAPVGLVLTVTPSAGTQPATAVPVSFSIGNAGTVIVQAADGNLTLLAALSNAGVIATTTSPNPQTLTISFLAPSGKGTAQITLTLAGPQITYQIGA